MRRQHGAALDVIRQIKAALDPQRRHEPRQARLVGPEERRPMALKVAMHNWMRPEPIETTITRLGAQWLRRHRDLRRAGGLRRRPRQAAARRQRPRVLGLGDADDRRPRPRARGPLRPAGQRAVRQGLPLARRLDGRQDPHGRAVDGRQGRRRWPRPRTSGSGPSRA